MAQMMVELNERLRLEDPPRAGRDVAGVGACFFLAANLVRQELGMAPLTASEAALDMAGQADRAGLMDFMEMKLDTLFNDGETLREKMGMATDFYTYI